MASTNILLLLALFSTMINLSIQQLHPPFTYNEGHRQAGVPVLKGDQVWFTTFYSGLKDGRSLNNWSKAFNNHSEDPDAYSLSAYPGRTGFEYIIDSESLYLRPGKPFRILCGGGRFMQVNEKYKLDYDRLDIYCATNTTPTDKPTDDELFTFRYYGNKTKGILRIGDQIQLIHIKTGTVLTFDTEKKIDPAAVVGMVYAGREWSTEQAIFYIGGGFRERPALRLSHAKAFRDSPITSEDDVFLINAGTLHQIRGANNGNDDKYKLDDLGIPVYAINSNTFNDPLRITSKSSLISSGKTVQFAYISSKLTAVKEKYARYSKDLFYIGMYYTDAPTRQDWKLEIFWGQDNKKGYLQSGDIIRLKNEEANCYFSTTYRPNNESMSGFRESHQLVCKPSSLPPSRNDYWYIANYQRSKHFDLNLSEVPAANGFTPKEATNDPFYPEAELLFFKNE